MSSNSPEISIILLTYNGDIYLSEVLEAVFAQNTQYTYEVIAIDSGSSDRTLEILRTFSVRVVQIPNSEFGHGRTRNLGVQSAAGRYIVFLTQDASPAGPAWLDNLVRPLVEDQRVAGSYSRQLPRPNCNPCEARDIAIGAGPLSVTKRVDFRDPFQAGTYRANIMRFISFSNVSSCVRKGTWEELPFSEILVMIEDQEWCKRAIESGYWIVYEASSAVYHSHNHSLKDIYRRHFDYGLSFREFVPLKLTFGNVLFYTIFECIGDIVFVLSHRTGAASVFEWILKSPAVRFSMRYGLYRGLHVDASVSVQTAGTLAKHTPPNTPS